MVAQKQSGQKPAGNMGIAASVAGRCILRL